MIWAVHAEAPPGKGSSLRGMPGSKLWNDCHVLRDDLSAWDLPALQQAGAQAGGMSYGDDVEPLT